MFFNYFACTVCLSSGSTTRTTADYCNDQERIISQVLILIARDSHNLDLTELRSLFFCYLKKKLQPSSPHYLYKRYRGGKVVHVSGVIEIALSRWNVHSFRIHTILLTVVCNMGSITILCTTMISDICISRSDLNN